MFNALAWWIAGSRAFFLVGRTVATIVELCFAAQWANLLENFARPAKENRTMTFSKLLFPAITVAEVFSWRGVLTTDNF
jgi:hypothetical protein